MSGADRVLDNLVTGSSGLLAGMERTPMSPRAGTYRRLTAAWACCQPPGRVPMDPHSVALAPSVQP